MARQRVRLTVLKQLAIGITLTVINLTGVLLTLAAIGGRGDWTIWQFLGLFGLLEWSTGIAIILGPNAWQLPIRRAADGEIPLVEARALLKPHWAPGVKALSGFVLMCAAAIVEGIGVVTLGIPLLAFFIVAGAMGLSLILARLGVARPDLDVFHVIIRRPGHPERELPGISAGASIVQAILNILTIPTVKVFPPSFLYHPEMGPSLSALGWYGAGAAVLMGIALFAWRGNVCWRAGAGPTSGRTAARARA